MKCSLLTLSTFVDEELAPERRGEVDAHLIGCPRCGAGVAALREEKLRVAQLTRVRVPADSAIALLESIGVSSARVQRRAAHSPQPEAASRNRPWLDGRSSAALPWTPRRPSHSPPATEEVSVPTVPVDVQPDLPFDGRASTVHENEPGPGVASGSGIVEWDHDEPEATSAVETEEQPAAEHPSPDEWELCIPGYAEHRPGEVIPPPPPDLSVSATAPGPASIRAGTAAVRTPATGAANAPADAVPPEPPRRVDSTGGPRVLWNRVRDMVGVRLALAGGHAELGDSLEIVTGAASPPRRSLPPPIAGFASPAAPAGRAPLPRRSARAPESPAAVPSAAGVQTARTLEAGQRAPTKEAASSSAPPPESARTWNAFGGSGYRESPPAPAADRAPEAAPLGRHARALRRPPSGSSVRARQALAAAGSVLRRGGSDMGSHAHRRAAASLPALSTQRRALIGVGAVALICLLALFVGRSLSPATAPARPGPISHATPSARAVPPPTASVAPATSAPATSAPALASPLTLGSGGSGYQLARVRYGALNGAQRIVFDLGTAGPGATGSPTVVVDSADTTTMLITFSGLAGAGSLSQPPSGGVVRSVTQMASRTGKTVFKLTLSRPATASAFYLNSPLRLVLDVR